MARNSTPPSVADATTKLSELLSAARGRRTLDDALGFLRCEPRTKTILSTKNSRHFRSLETSSSLDSTADPPSSPSDPDGGKSPDLAASMRLVRSYAASVKKMPSNPDGFLIPFLSPAGGSGPQTRGSFRRESLRRMLSLRQSLPPPCQNSPGRPTSILRPTYFSPERNVLFKAATVLVTRLIAEQGPPVRPFSDESRPAPQDYPPAAGSQRRVPALLPAGEDPVKTVKPRNAATPASRHGTIPRRRRSSTELCARPALDLDCLDGQEPLALPASASSSSASSRRFHVRGISWPSAQSTEVFY
ncbi:hypothetical protein T484DRAFT_1961149 [Baffinella frigidus]|nr:hypothetical protein T484DRAFT_1961149 [Cryptophyta sp. CCMP2293]